MRPSLRHQIGERRRTHRTRGAHRPDSVPETTDPTLEPPVAAQEPHVAAQEPPVAAQEPPVAAQEPPVAAQEPPVAAQEPDIDAQEPPVAAQEPPVAAQEPDIDAQRVREAGGPTDQASYACQCGYLFAASVSTTVECPHCRASQAW